MASQYLHSWQLALLVIIQMSVILGLLSPLFPRLALIVYCYPTAFANDILLRFCD